MRRFLGWLTMVILLVCLLVGGVIAVFYFLVNEGNLPAEPTLFAGQTLTACGYDWQVPVLSNGMYREFSSQPTLQVQKLKTASETPVLALPTWANESQLVLRDADGTQVFAGTAEEYARFSYPADGVYEGELTLGHHIENERPAQPQGQYTYRFRFTLSMAINISLSLETQPQGGVFGVYVYSMPGAPMPQGECDLGQMWFAPYGDGWLGYLPVAYNAPAGEYVLIVTQGEKASKVQVTVTSKATGTSAYEPDETETEEAAKEYKEVIWPLYTEGAEDRLWGEKFQMPVTGNVLLDFAAAYQPKNGKPGVHNSSNITFNTTYGTGVLCPADGVVVYAGDLLLTGKTIVIDHGCGLKSYLFGMGTLAVEKGDGVHLGDRLGTTGEAPLQYEMKIGSKSINPWNTWQGSNGLFYMPVV